MRENRQVIVDVLFPVIGPAIRKAIAEALRNLVADLNGAIESSFTPRGIRWRIEAWRSGVPYAQIVLKHTLNYGIDHVFLIERDSGLVLDRESAPHLPDLDADAIAGMLTAIGEFVRDSVGRDGGGTLDSARVGEHLLWVVQGPRANLACFIHGVPPPACTRCSSSGSKRSMRSSARRRRRQRTTMHGAQSLRPEELMRAARAADRIGARRRDRAGRCCSCLLAVARAARAGSSCAASARTRASRALRARLSAHPGFVLTGIERRGAMR